MSLAASLPILVEWSDCDGNDSVRLGRYADWCDAGTSALFQRAGLPWTQLFRFNDVVGVPVVALTLDLRSPARFGETLALESSIIDWRPRSFRVSHVLSSAEGVRMEAAETRIWGVRDPETPRLIRAGTIPEEIRVLFQG